jgi:hypothetical protein
LRQIQRYAAWAEIFHTSLRITHTSQAAPPLLVLWEVSQSLFPSANAGANDGKAIGLPLPAVLSVNLVAHKLSS